MLRVRLICELIIGSITGIYENRHVISVDEKTGIQALSRKELMMQPGKVKKQEYEYRRNGTTTLIAAVDVSSGQIVHEHPGPTRNEGDFAQFCQELVKKYPAQDEIIILADQLNTHKSASLVEWIAEQTGFEEDLGVKGKKGILKSMESRMQFLENEQHRIRFVYSPKHCSWLNPIENWFGKLQKHVITGGVFESVEQLEERIRAYIEYYNRCLVKPLNWKFKGFLKGKSLDKPCSH